VAPVEPRSIRKLVADGRHNAFTALVRWREQYWLAFRAATDHNSGDGDIVVLRSRDAENWSEALRLNVTPDDRDPQMVATDKRLFLYDAAMTGAELTTYLTFTDDGELWSKPQPVYEPRFIVWKPTRHDGRFYSAAHKKDEASGGKGREVHLVASDDGINWKKISTIRAGNWESETTLHFAPNHHVTGFLRQKYGSPPAQILESDPPYTEWKSRAPNVSHFSGHCVHTFRGVTYVLSRTMDYSTRTAGTMIYTFDGRELKPYCKLPSSGDCAYPEAVEVGDEMLVSYYSSHEGSTNIYLARVPLLGQATARAADHDFLIRGATIHDGRGGPPVVADIAIRGERISAIGNLADAKAGRVIDGNSLVAAPGFIDLHTHSDDPIQKERTRANLNYLLQGVTTIVTGNCGGGPTDVAKMFATIDEHGAGTNVIHLIPQGSLRRKVVGESNRPATDDELAEMKRLVDQEMKNGTWGMSTGLIYTPSCYAPTEELIELSKIVAAHGGIYASHIRGEDWDSLLPSIREAIRIGREAGLPAHISHLKASGPKAWGMMPEACKLIEDARAEGLPVTADQYPYIASSTNLAAMTVPNEDREGGYDALAKRLQDAENSASLKDRIAKTLADRGGGKTIRIASYSKHTAWQGKSLVEVAEAEGREVLDVTLEILSNGGASAVSFGMSEDDVRFAMQKPYVATASDGGAKIPDSTVPHPRSYGCFPRKIGRYAIEEKVVPLEFAIRASSGLPADILKLPDRGYLKPGNFADLVVFDPVEFRDVATFDEPHQYARGMRYVWVNGKLAINGGKFTETLAGRALRHGQ
jgi:N-acyl-D-aspartate/D-glutamate deacylase